MLCVEETCVRYSKMLLFCYVYHFENLSFYVARSVKHIEDSKFQHLNMKFNINIILRVPQLTNFNAEKLDNLLLLMLCLVSF